MKQLILLAAVAATLAFAGCTTSDNGDDTGHLVVMKDIKFVPATLTIEVGETVTWRNQDAVPHTVTSDDGNFTSSGSMTQGMTHVVTFDTPGTYPYHCEPHPTMTGTITVTEAAAEA